MKIYHAKAYRDINIINSNVVNSKKTTNITNHNSSPNTTRINLSRMKNLFEKRITNSKKNNPLPGQ
jgi:hypothetical protein